MTGIDKLELTGAVRAGSYNTFGGFVTGKGGVRWQIVPDLALRGTLSNAFRAPNVADLFTGAVTGFPGVTDPCGDPMNRAAAVRRPGDPRPRSPTTAASCPSILSGNPNLQPEKATTFTAGVVFTPTFFKGFSVTLDYFNINIDDVIDQRERADHSQQLLPLGIDPRMPEGPPRSGDPRHHQHHRSEPVNIGNFKTAGLDFDVAYRFRVPKVGNLRLNVEGTWLQKFEETIAGGPRSTASTTTTSAASTRASSSTATRSGRTPAGAPASARASSVRGTSARTTTAARLR